MAKSALLESLFKAYCGAEPSKQAQETARAFCTFATAELADRGVIGASYTPTGLALRFADGQELPILDIDSTEASGVSVQVTGGAEKLNARASSPNGSPSFPITGA